MPALSDPEIIEKLKISPKDKVLDVGGSANQHENLEVDTLVDQERPEDSPYYPAALKAKHFVKVDIAQQRLPFKDKQFDVCLCTHTLEDLYDPFLILAEMSRVAKRGYIATPSRGKDMEFGHFNLTDWLTGARRQPGLSHHHWFFETKDNHLYITPKIYPVLYTSEFFITRWSGEEECHYFWQGKVNYRVFNSTSQHQLIAEYQTFMKNNRTLIQKGPVLFYVDNPWYVIKEIGKLLFHRGMGFKK